MEFFHTTKNVTVEQTEDGMFLAYYVNDTACYAYGETEDEAAENLREHYDFGTLNWGDTDEYGSTMNAFY